MSNSHEQPVEHLVMLIGSNPLPNLVAALCLLQNRERSQLLLVYSQHTDTQRRALEKVLQERKEGFKEEQFIRIPVEEANADDIFNQVTKHVQGLRGQVRLNYTGGTKAMAVHAYQALACLVAERNIDPVQYSYLDAHTLSMHTIEPDGARRRFAAEPEVSLHELLRLHSHEPNLKPTPLWPRTTEALMQLHQTQGGPELWKQWVAQTFLVEPEWPKFSEADLSSRDEEWRDWVRQNLLWKSKPKRKWKPNNKINFDIPEALSGIFQTLRDETRIDEPLSASKLKSQGGFSGTGDCGKWFEGEWLESYVLDQVLKLKALPGNPARIGDVARDIQAKSSLQVEHAKGPRQIQVDVAFMRGYQLFMLSCTTDRGLAKSKLLEAVVRAEQLGGAEARVGLVCSDGDVAALKGEVADLLGPKVAVFGVPQLPTLADELYHWIKQASREAPED